MKKNLILMSALFAGSMFMNDGFGDDRWDEDARHEREIIQQQQEADRRLEEVRQYGANAPADNPDDFFNFNPKVFEFLSPAEKEARKAEEAKKAEEARKARLKKCVKYGLAATTAIAGVAAYLGHQYLPTVVASCTAVPSVIPSKGGFNITEPMYCGIKSSTVPFQCGDYQNMTSLIAELDEKYPNLNSTKYSDTFKEICPDLDSDTQEDESLKEMYEKILKKARYDNIDQMMRDIRDFRLFNEGPADSYEVVDEEQLHQGGCEL